MKSMTIRFDDDLMAWLQEQANLNSRSVNRELEFLVKSARKEFEKQRCNVGLILMCANGVHNFKQHNPAMNDFCNCGMFVYGEVCR